MSADLPFISVVLPCRNENKAIVAAALSLLRGTYPPARFEIIIVDGMSTDGTRDVLQRFVGEHPGVRLIDNPERTTPYGMNAGIRAAKGDLVGIFNGHSEFSPDILHRIAAAHAEHKADVVGGISKRRPKLDTPWGVAIAEATMHPFCSGDAHWRRGADTVREADTVINACARRDVFERFGLFDTRLDRAQDREMWNRVRNKGGRILLDPKIISWQQTRSGVYEYTAWTARGAKYLFYGALLVDHPIVGLRNFIPLGFTLYVLSLLPALLLLPWWLGLPYAAPGILYVVLSLRYALAMLRARGDAGLALRLLLLFPLTHIAYGAGALAGCALGLAARLRR